MLIYQFYRHTHEDIDQYFSSLSRFLQKHDVLTMPQMIEAVFACSSHKAEGIEIDVIYDFKAWFNDCIQPMSNHQGPHCYKIRRDLNGKAEILYKVTYAFYLKELTVIEIVYLCIYAST